jgi:hypothetical protein
VITIEINEDDLPCLLDGLNNAIIAYNNIIGAIKFGFEVHSKLQPLENLSHSELDDRIKALIGLYDQLAKLE